MAPSSQELEPPANPARFKVYRSIDELQADLDLWIREYNEQRPH